MQVAPPGGASMDAAWMEGPTGCTPMRERGSDLATSNLDHSVSGIRWPLKVRGSTREIRGHKGHSRVNPPIGSQDGG